MIDSLFVDPDKRGLGAGRALIDCLDRIFPEGDTLVRAEFNIENENNESLPGVKGAEQSDDVTMLCLEYKGGR